MSTMLAEADALNGYQLHLPTFEGPLDVLLRLIERSQLAITDVSLVAVTDQFLAYVEALGGASAETIAEFAAVGARLVLLKSRSLLPRPPIAEEAADPGELVQQLVAYRSFKEVASHLADRDAVGAGAFARGSGGVVVPESAPPRLAIHPPVALARALRRRLTLVPSPPALAPLRPLVSLREMVERVLTALSGQPGLRFDAVAARCAGRHELLTAFLAVLVLVRRRLVEAEQVVLFGEITLRPAPATQEPRDDADEAADD